MNTKTLFTTAAVLGVLAIAAVAMARGGHGYGYGYGGHMMAPGYHHGQTWQGTALTPEQRAEFETLRQEHWKQIQPLRTELFAKQAKLDALMVDPAANKAAIDNLIDEIATQNAQLEKLRITFRTEVAEKFGLETMGRGWRGHRGGGHGMGPGMMGQGMNYGPGQCAGYGRW